MILNDKPYTNLNDFLTIVSRETFSKKWKYKKTGGYYVYNVPCSFDIETSSFYNSKFEKQSIMYIWQVCINGNCFIGRTWKDFLLFTFKICNVLKVNSNNRLVFYVHNLGYEFQFMRKYFNWNECFLVDDRTPIKCCTDTGIEFRDSYILSGYSLAKTSEQLNKYHVKKLVGNLDYALIRTPDTRLTEKELQYCINDVLVVCAYIQEQIEMYENNINLIPLTNTGRVRNYCRIKCYEGFEGDKKQNKLDYKKLMHNLTIEENEYKLLKRCFMGGFTHGNFEHIGDVMTNVSSYDFTSSYPYVMVSEQFPMGKGFQRTIKNFDEYKKLEKMYCMCFDIELLGVSPKLFQDSPISKSKCWILENEVVNNGRVMYADKIITSGTNLDLDIYLEFYNVEHCNIYNCYCYEKKYLPKNFILSILKLYSDKTTLKGVEGKEVEYLHSKGMLNSCYGMCVTDIVQDERLYSENDEYIKINADVKYCIEKYNSNHNRFLYYPWGIFVTAYARRNLFLAIKECKNDYVYSDTDSVKIINADRHKQFFTDYNKLVELKLKLVSETYNIPFKMFAPKTIKGKEKMLGVWDYEGTYKYFKALRSKCYIYTDSNNNLHATVAGCGKNNMVEYLKEISKNEKDLYSNFCNGLKLQPEYTGKMTHTYIDNEMSGIVTDYLGRQYNYDEMSGIHLEKTGFEISLGSEFIKFLKGYKYTYGI